MGTFQHNLYSRKAEQNFKVSSTTQFHYSIRFVFLNLCIESKCHKAIRKSRLWSQSDQDYNPSQCVYWEQLADFKLHSSTLCNISQSDLSLFKSLGVLRGKNHRQRFDVCIILTNIYTLYSIWVLQISWRDKAWR